MMKALYHKDIEPYLDKLANEPEFRIGNFGKYKPDGKEWYRERVYLEFPIGELANGFMTRLALCGRQEPIALPIETGDKFNAQGLEGKARVERDFFGALMAMRDILPKHRGRIVLNGK
jgi:hypothetical protein